MLSMVGTPRRRRRFLVYDMEWVPGTLVLRLIGVFDGKRYRCYKTIEAFLDGELTSGNRGIWMYAHFGGGADFEFILHAMESRPDYKVKCAFSGSSAIICTITRVPNGKNAWHFVDSYWLLRDKLENIAKWIGMEKGAKEQREEDAKEFYASAPLDILIEYNEQDCVILWNAISQMQDFLWNLGGQMQKTLASSAMQLFRRRFLKQDISTYWAVNEKAMNAYFASRVEVISHECYDAEYYDINSSFPYAMTFPCPGEFKGVGVKLPEGKLYIAEVTVTVPETRLPILPMRLKGRLFFPIGTWRGWWSSVDLELLQEEGGRIVKVHQAFYFESFDDLKEYALTLYQMRLKAQTPFEKTALKLAMNSLYGKFAEGEEKESLILHPDVIDREEWEMLFPGAWMITKTVPVPHRHVPVSVFITARARQTLYEYASPCETVHYFDTDGFSTNDKLFTEDRLGGLKLEKRIRRGRFVAPKIYCLEGEELTKDGWKELGDKGVRAKGFSRMTVAKFEELLEGKTVRYERMRRIRELARSGGFKPTEDIIEKQLRHTTIPKRFHYPDGESRPWHVKELKSHFGSLEP